MRQRSILLTALSTSCLFACGDVEAIPDAGPDAPAPDAPAPDAPAPDAPAPDAPQTEVNLTMTQEPTDAVAARYFVAYRDGDGLWAAAPRVAPGQYRFAAPSGRYQVAVGCSPDTSTMILVYGLTVAELPMPILPAGCAPRTAQLTGTITGTVAPVLVSAGGLVTIATGSYQVEVVPGIHDLFAATFTGTGPARTATAVLLRPQVNVTTSTTLDLDLAQATAPIARAVTVGLLPGETGAVTSNIATADTSLRLSNTIAAPFAYLSVPAPQRGSALHRVSINTTSPDRLVRNERWVTGDADLVVEATPAGPLPTISLSSRVPYPRFDASWTTLPPADAVVLSAEQVGCGTECFRYWEVVGSAAFIAAGGSIALPDLSLLPSWRTLDQFELGEPVLTFAATVTATGGAAAYWTTTHAAGDRRTKIGRETTITP